MFFVLNRSAKFFSSPRELTKFMFTNKRFHLLKASILKTILSQYTIENNQIRQYLITYLIDQTEEPELEDLLNGEGLKLE